MKTIAFILATLLSSSIHAETTKRTYIHGITMVNIPAGSFMMGYCTEEHNNQLIFSGNEDDVCEVDDKIFKHGTPRHHVEIDSFQMGETEVTLGQFKKFISDTGRTDLIDKDFIQANSYGDNAPVTMVSWHDAKSFVSWLNKVEGGGWRLPSEAEWEYACRSGGINQRYCGADSYEGFQEISWSMSTSGRKSWRDSGQRPHDVGTKRPNSFGLYDMTGNVAEWVEDCSYNYINAPKDGTAWTKNCGDSRLVRGGSYMSSDYGSRAKRRHSEYADQALILLGFRLAKDR